MNNDPERDNLGRQSVSLDESTGVPRVERFHEILAKRHDYARDWKARTGGKVLGYYEPYMLGIEALTSKYDPRLAGAIGATLIAGAARS